MRGPLVIYTRLLADWEWEGPREEPCPRCPVEAVEQWRTAEGRLQRLAGVEAGRSRRAVASGGWSRRAMEGLADGGVRRVVRLAG